MRTINYEDAIEFDADAYQHPSYRGVAMAVLGWETEPDEDTHWTGFEERTGKVCYYMIGDDRVFTCDPEELTPIQREDYCGVCGQIGCSHDGIER